MKKEINEIDNKTKKKNKTFLKKNQKKSPKKNFRMIK